MLVFCFWTHFGHAHERPKSVQNLILETFWTLLDTFWTLFGHFLDFWTLFGHVLDIFGHGFVLDTFWTRFGHGLSRISTFGHGFVILTAFGHRFALIFTFFSIFFKIVFVRRPGVNFCFIFRKQISFKKGGCKVYQIHNEKRSL